MKWGVRRGSASKAYEKANEKKRKLEKNLGVSESENRKYRKWKKKMQKVFSEKPLDDAKDKYSKKADKYLKKYKEASVKAEDISSVKREVEQKKAYLKEYNDLADVTNKLYWKRYEGNKLTKKETDTLNKGLKRLEELDEMDL